jgi:histidinol-phosphate/aromatic aminotransferase/cobyric acid decarboxylase-like protein
MAAIPAPPAALSADSFGKVYGLAGVRLGFAVAGLAEKIGRRGIRVRRFVREPEWLRFGLPADDTAFSRVAAALAQPAFRSGTGPATESVRTYFHPRMWMGRRSMQRARSGASFAG